MSAEAINWLILTAAIFAAIAVCSTIAAIVESWLERKRERKRRLPQPAWRARVREPHKYSRWWV